MSQQINYTQEDRDRSIRTESEVNHIDTAVHILKGETKDLVELTRNQAFTIAGILESMKDAKAFMHEVGQHNQRLAALESKVSACDADRRDYNKDLDDLKQWKDRAWFLGKIVAWVTSTGWALSALIVGLQFIKGQ